VKVLSALARFRAPDALGYWAELARGEYRRRFGLELDPLQTDRTRTPGLDEVARIQSESKADPAVFLGTGLRAALTYLDELAAAGVDPAGLTRILEFGVGYARILRHFAPFAAELHGCDVTPQTIRWCEQNVGGLASFAVSRADPPLPYADAHFDFVYANSVFTHIQHARTPAWIRELRRVTRRGGVVISSHYDLNEHLRHFSTEEVDHAFRSAGFLEWGDASVRQSNVCYAPERLESLWGEHFEVLATRCYLREQAHLVCRVAR
jgi:SAM-dependent methyltransferase